MKHQLYIGTSGWNYRSWRTIFYPGGLPAARWLLFYATKFSSVEINYSFYRLPTEQQCRSWYVNTPAHFRFALKASRYLTHVKRLRDVHEAWEIYFDRVCVLKEKLGPILFQFPSNFRATIENRDSIRSFLSYVRGRTPALRLAFEFREARWLDDYILALLKQYNVTLVISHSTRYPVFDADIPADYAYFRFHGPREMCASSYSISDLQPWAAALRSLLKRHIDVYAYFNNDVECYAPRDALNLIGLLNTESEPSATTAAAQSCGSPLIK